LPVIAPVILEVFFMVSATPIGTAMTGWTPSISKYGDTVLSMFSRASVSRAASITSCLVASFRSPESMSSL